MSSISCISEPEAAAVYTLGAIQPNILRLHDNFVVCDAGGGTVDLITYKVTKLSPLVVEESVVGSGGLCGSTYLNRRYVRMCVVSGDLGIANEERGAGLRNSLRTGSARKSWGGSARKQRR